MPGSQHGCSGRTLRPSLHRSHCVGRSRLGEGSRRQHQYCRAEDTGDVNYLGVRHSKDRGFGGRPLLLRFSSGARGARVRRGSDGRTNLSGGDKYSVETVDVVLLGTSLKSVHDWFMMATDAVTVPFLARLPWNIKIIAIQWHPMHEPRKLFGKINFIHSLDSKYLFTT